MHFYAWKKGLKTGQYYFRSRPARDAIKFTVNVESLLAAADTGDSNQVLACLSKDNNQTFKQQNLRKKKRVEAKKSDNDPNAKARPADTTKAASSTVPEKKEEEEESADEMFECIGCGS